MWQCGADDDPPLLTRGANIVRGTLGKKQTGGSGWFTKI